MKDGLYRVSTTYLCGGFIISNNKVTSCAPILRKKLEYWKTISTHIGETMQRYGEAPFLECSSKGDKRFSAFYARIKCMDNKTIEHLYQSAKVFASGSKNYSVQNRKGVLAENQEEVRELYRRLWHIYFRENPELVRVLLAQTGLSDIYGQTGHACQSEELWKIRCRLLKVQDIEAWIAKRKNSA